MNNTTQHNSIGKLIILGFQHVLAMFGATVLVPLLTGLPMSVALFAAGVGTLIFHFITKRKVPVFLGSSFAFIGGIIAVKDITGDIAYATGGIMAAGVMYLVLALLVYIFGAQKVRSFFPPVVTGPIIITIGLFLAPVAINSIISVAEGGALWVNWVIAASVLVTMMVVSVFAKGFFKMVPILFGITVGFIVSLIFNASGYSVVNFEALEKASWFSVPAFVLPKFSWQAVAIIAPISIVTFVEHIGDVTANGAVVGEDFFKDPGLHRTLIGDGVATMLAGFLGGPANTTYGENTGVLAATKNYDPRSLRIAACFAIVLSFFGKFSGLLSSLPGPVMGGISIILFGMIASVGLRALVEGNVDFKKSRNLIIVAIMLVLGLGGASFVITDQVAISGVALSAIVGIILNKVLPEHIDN